MANVEEFNFNGVLYFSVQHSEERVGPLSPLPKDVFRGPQFRKDPGPLVHGCVSRIPRHRRYANGDDLPSRPGPFFIHRPVRQLFRP